MLDLDTFKDDLTPEIKAAARERILMLGNIASRDDLSDRQKRMILLLVQEWKPDLMLTQEERALSRGCCVKALLKDEHDQHCFYVVK